MKLSYVACSTVKDEAKSLIFAGELAEKMTSLGVPNLIQTKFFMKIPADCEIDPLKFHPRIGDVPATIHNFPEEEFNIVPFSDGINSMIWAK